MQDVATRVDQSCHRCKSGEKCVYATWSAAYIWLEVEQRLQRLIECPQGPCAWCAHASQAIRSLMWHYGQRVYFESEESA